MTSKVQFSTNLVEIREVEPDDPVVSRISTRLDRKRSINIPQSPFAAIDEGQTVPDDLCEEIPYSKMGIPIKEIGVQSFIVMGRGVSWFGSQKRMKLFRFSTTKSFLLFNHKNLFRRLSVYMITHPVFEILIPLTIIANAIFMSTNDTCPVAE